MDCSRSQSVPSHTNVTRTDGLRSAGIGAVFYQVKGQRSVNQILENFMLPSDDQLY